MSPDESAAAVLFLSQIRQTPQARARLLQGRFLQTYTRLGGVLASEAPLRWFQHGHLRLPHRPFTGKTQVVVLSHPASQAIARPDADIYAMAEQAAQTASTPGRDRSVLLFDPMSVNFFRVQGRRPPRGGAPAFHLLEDPFRNFQPVGDAARCMIRVPDQRVRPVPARTSLKEFIAGKVGEYPFLRPDSPTLASLVHHARFTPIFGGFSIPLSPAARRNMTAVEAAAADAFRRAVHQADPQGNLRAQGEFFQTFAPGPDGGTVAATPLVYAAGSFLEVPKDAVTERTTMVIHSHPARPLSEGHNDFPSAQDFLGAYLHSRGNTTALRGEMMYHAGSDTFYAFAPRVDPETLRPHFVELVRPPAAGPGGPRP